MAEMARALGPAVESPPAWPLAKKLCTQLDSLSHRASLWTLETMCLPVPAIEVKATAGTVRLLSRRHGPERLAYWSAVRSLSLGAASAPGPKPL